MWGSFTGAVVVGFHRGPTGLNKGGLVMKRGQAKAGAPIRSHQGLLE